MQVWREVGVRKFVLICTTDATLKAKLQTIPDATAGGCSHGRYSHSGAA